MKTAIFILFLGLWQGVFGQETRESDLLKKEIFNDSLQVFLRYQNEIDDLKAVPDYDTATWNRRAEHDHTVTCAMIKKLKEYNGSSYDPVDSFKREGFITAYIYPAPSQRVRKTLFADNERRFRFVVYDRTTRFICDSVTHKTKVPYILRIIYQNGVIIEKTKLDPINNLPIE